MKKILLILVLLGLSTLSLADDRYKFYHFTNKESLPRVTVIDTKTGNIAYCDPEYCTVNLIMGSANFKEAFAKADKAIKRLRKEGKWKFKE